jgi:hypothetical protein
VSDQWQTVDKLLDLLISGYQEMPRDGDDPVDDRQYFTASLHRLASPHTTGQLLACAIARLADREGS